MRITKYFLCVLTLLFVVGARAQDRIRISHVGLGPDEVYGSTLPTPVSVHIPALPQSRLVQLQFQFETSPNDQVPLSPLPHRVLKQIQLVAGVPSDFEVPLPLPTEYRLILHLSVMDDSGGSIGEAQRELKSHGIGGRNLVVIHCLDEKICAEADSQVRSNTDVNGRVTRTNARMIESLQEPFDRWWDYGAADFVVICRPTSNLNTGQRGALEGYLRSGGTLILMESEIADATFLAAYRQGISGASVIPVGRGRLIRLSGLPGKDLSKAVNWEKSKESIEVNGRDFPGSPDDFFLNRIGISFTFPRLRWLIIWLGIFIIGVGPINFYVLHRLQRLEWGWFTICAISILFAAGLYIANSSRRPKDFTLDDAAIYWMDGKGTLALAQYGFRVYSPERNYLTLSTNKDDALLLPDWMDSFDGSGVDIGIGLSGKSGALTGWQLQLGSPQQIEFPVLRWSFQDFHAEAFRNFPGTIHWTSPMHLRNDSGESFREAVYMDFKANLQYVIPRVAPGDEIDLTAIHPTIIYVKEKQMTPIELYQQALEQRRQGPVKPFSVTEVPHSNMQIPKNGCIFVGWSESRISNAVLSVPVAARPGGALVIVALEKND